MLVRQLTPIAASAAVLITLAAGQAVAQDVPLLPPGAKPGQCYTRIYVPPTYSTEVEELVTTDGTEHLEVIPAQFEWAEENVLVKEEIEKIEVIPATYKTVTEQVLIKPPTEELEIVPAEYDVVEEKVLVREAYTTWKKGSGPIQKIDESTGEILCLVEVPAEYKSVERRKLRTPPTTRVVPVPAEYKTIKKQVVDTPAETRVTKIPAEYISVKVQKLVEPAKAQRSPIPDELMKVERTVKVSDGGVEWRQILCDTNMTREVIADIQSKLKAAGAYFGPVDGALGPMTMRGVRAYQQANNLPAGQLTIETLDALGVQL